MAGGASLNSHVQQKTQAPVQRQVTNVVEKRLAKEGIESKMEMARTIDLKPKAETLEAAQQDLSKATTLTNRHDTIRHMPADMTVAVLDNSSTALANITNADPPEEAKKVFEQSMDDLAQSIYTLGTQALREKTPEALERFNQALDKFADIIEETGSLGLDTASSFSENYKDHPRFNSDIPTPHARYLEILRDFQDKLTGKTDDVARPPDLTGGDDDVVKPPLARGGDDTPAPPNLSGGNTTGGTAFSSGSGGVRLNNPLNNLGLTGDGNTPGGDNGNTSGSATASGSSRQLPGNNSDNLWDQHAFEQLNWGPLEPNFLSKLNPKEQNSIPEELIDDDKSQGPGNLDLRAQKPIIPDKLPFELEEPDDVATIIDRTPDYGPDVAIDNNKQEDWDATATHEDLGTVWEDQWQEGQPFKKVFAKPAEISGEIIIKRKPSGGQDGGTTGGNVGGNTAAAQSSTAPPAAPPEREEPGLTDLLNTLNNAKITDFTNSYIKKINNRSDASDTKRLAKYSAELCDFLAIKLGPRSMIKSNSTLFGNITKVSGEFSKAVTELRKDLQPIAERLTEQHRGNLEAMSESDQKLVDLYQKLSTNQAKLNDALKPIRRDEVDILVELGDLANTEKAKNDYVQFGDLTPPKPKAKPKTARRW